MMGMLGQRLVEAGLIKDSQLQAALNRKKEQGGFLGEILIEMGVVTAKQVGQTLQDAIDALPSGPDGGGTIFIPAGVYSIAAPGIKITQPHVVLRGVGQSTKLKAANAERRFKGQSLKAKG